MSRTQISYVFFLALTLVGCSSEIDHANPNQPLVASTVSASVDSTDQNTLQLNDGIDLDSQLVNAEVNIELQELLGPMTDLGVCTDQVSDMYLALGSWERVTETVSDVSATHYYFHYAGGIGYGFQQSRNGSCSTNYTV